VSDVDERSEWSGPCLNGPYRGVTLTSRFPKGVLLVDRPGNRAWIYEWVGGAFQVRDSEPTELISDRNAPKNRWRAALEPNYDVKAYDPELVVEP
jgi:hypothetical protein